jgi:hypothetical protein
MVDIRKSVRGLFDQNTCHNPQCLFDHFNITKLIKNTEKVQRASESVEKRLVQIKRPEIKIQPLHAISECKSDRKPEEYMCTNCFQYGHHEKLCTSSQDDDADDESDETYNIPTTKTEPDWLISDHEDEEFRKACQEAEAALAKVEIVSLSASQ